MATLTMSVASILGIAGYYLIAELIDAFSTAPDKDTQLEVLVFWGTLFFILTLVERGLWRVSGFLGIKWLVDVHATGYRVLYQYLVNHSHNYFSNRFAGALSNKVSNGVDGGVRLAERVLWGVGPEIISLFATILLFWLVHWSVALILLITIILVLALNIWFVRIRKKYVVSYSKASSKVRGEGVDLISNISAVRQYSRKLEELDRLDSSIEDRARKDKKQWFMGEWLMVINTVIGLLLTAVILMVVYRMLVIDMATIGSLVLVLSLLGRVGFIFATLGNMLNGLVRMYGETEEGLEDILVEYDITDNAGAKKTEHNVWAY